MKTTEKEKCFGKRLPYIAPKVKVMYIKIEKGYILSNGRTNVEIGGDGSNEQGDADCEKW